MIILSLVNKNEIFLKVQLEKIQNMFSSTNEVLYADYYLDIENENLRDIFIILHTKLNNLLAFVNDKNSPGHGGHYNAEPSRDLLEVINVLRVIQANFKNNPLNFELDTYYEGIINRCKAFLSKSGGSPIPEDFPHVDIIEHKPIFMMLEVTKVSRPESEDTFPIKLIGGGSYATVYKFKDSHYNRLFALKRANKDLTPKELQRFKDEFFELSNLNSPYIIEVYNYNDDKNEYTMEYADITLDKYISTNNSKLPMTQRVSIILQLFKAFSYIHAKHLLHRDISYLNILIKKYDDSTMIIKVSDFGLVKSKDSTLTSTESSIKGMLNDPALTIVGFANYELRHEIYALSQVINFVLSGKKNGIFDKSQVVKDFIIRGLASDIEERFASVEEMAEAFSKLRTELN